MIKHVVVFRWKDGVSDDEIADVVAGLARLPGRIAVLDDYTFGADLGLTEGTGDFAIIATVADVTALRAYLEHPEHVPVAQGLRALADSRMAVQIQV